ncbi:MAG: right-handed parallel beta-helix repeat-containing protein, partial [Acidobacteriota bacterium]
TEGVAGNHGWKNITLRNCVLEAADMETADFADYAGARASGVLIEGCTFKGGGLSASASWRNTLNFEMPLGVVVRNNTFYRAGGDWGCVLNVTDSGTKSGSGPGAIFTGNTFDLDYDNGIADEDGYPIMLMGFDNQFTNNTINRHYGTRSAVALYGAHNNTVAGNTFNIGDRASVWELNAASGNTLSPNTVN